MKRVRSVNLFLLSFCFTIFLFWISLPTDVQGSVETEKEKLLHGYDVTSGKDLSEIDAFKKKIINPKSDYLNDENIELFEGVDQHFSYFDKSSLSEVSSDFAAKISSGVFGRIYVVDADVSSTFNMSKSLTNICSEKYELYTAWIARRAYIINLKPYLIRQYLDDTFKKDLYSVKSKTDAKELFTEYGTHLITGYMYGGRLNITNYRATNDIQTNLSQGASLESKVSIAISAVQGGGSGSIVENYGSYENTKTSTSNYNFSAIGGVAVSGLTLDGLFTFSPSLTGVDKSGFMYTTWINSISEGNNLAIIGIPNGANSIPLWELLDDNDDRSDSIKQNLIDAYIEMCGDKYDEYLKKFPNNKVTLGNYSQEDSILPEYKGAYIRTPNDYFYYVDQSDLVDGGNHSSLQYLEYIYLDIEKKDGLDELSFDCQGCTVVDDNQGIFKINKSSGNVVIKVKCGGKSRKLIDLPIKDTGFEGGTGTEEYPYIITNASQFQQISRESSSYFVLYADIDFNGNAISSMGEFTGVLDGNYCTISNFTINQAKEWGLFSTNSGTIKNLSILNAGTSMHLSDFTDGGIDYKSVYKNESYRNNSVEAISAGLLCANNKGTIEGCYINNAYIRNVVKDRADYIIDLKVSLNVGAVAGINQGTIKDTKTSNCRILNSFIYEDQDADVNLVNLVHTGGLIGELQGGTVSGCVVDTDSTGALMSQNNVIYDGSIVNHCHATMHSYAAGLIGYCNCEATVKNNYCYIRSITNSDSYKAIDAEYIHGFHEPDNYYVMCSASVIYGENASVAASDNYAVCFDPDIILSSVTPTKNSEEKNEKDTYKFLDGFSEKIINGQTDINTIGMSSTYFYYDSAQNSHVKHLLQKTRKDYIELDVDISGENLTSEFYEGQQFKPKNIALIRHINTKSAEAVQYYKIAIQESSRNCLDKKFELKEAGAYNLTFSIYSNDIKTESIPIVINENKIIGIAVENEEGDNESCIYLDKKEKYFEADNWKEGLRLYLLKGNGSREEVTMNSEMAECFYTDNSADSINVGENRIKVNYRKGQTYFETYYVLMVEERMIDSIILSDSIKHHEYKKGEKVSDVICKDTEGIRIKYKNGDEESITGKEALANIEVIGDVIALGQNHIVVTYMDYKIRDSFDVDAEESEFYLDEENEASNVKTDVNIGIGTDETSISLPQETNLPNESENIQDISKEAVTLSDSEKDDDNGNRTVIWIILGILVVAGGVAAYLIIQQKRKDENTSKKETLEENDILEEKENKE